MAQGRGKTRFRRAKAAMSQVLDDFKRQISYLTVDQVWRELNAIIEEYDIVNDLDPVRNWQELWQPRLAAAAEEVIRKAFLEEERRLAREEREAARRQEERETEEAEEEEESSEEDAEPTGYAEGWPIFGGEVPTSLRDKVTIRRTGFETIEAAIEYSAPFASYVAGFIELDGLYFAVVEK